VLRQGIGDRGVAGRETVVGDRARSRLEMLTGLLDAAAKRALDVTAAVTFLLVLAPLVAVLVAAIKVDSRGPAFYRCRRVGHRGREFAMLKFRKMRDGAAGPALTSTEDERFTRLGRFLASTKLDEIPQLWNVLKGDMSLVGPRPEDPSFVALDRPGYDPILQVKPGITGLSQLAFAVEPEILDPSDRVGHYVKHIMPQKMRLDRIYARRRTVAMDLRILGWTAAAVLFKRQVAVNRETAQLTVRTPRESGVTPAAQAKS
jgi:lipopolysaccharide/colanic/teichoic acid biosynthesis glycosyltransferase